MFKIIGIIVFGVIIGILLRQKLSVVVVSKVITSIIYLLLLILGIAVGANEEIISNLDTLGYKALVITLGSLLGSCLFALLIFKKMFNKSQNN